MNKSFISIFKDTMTKKIFLFAGRSGRREFTIFSVITIIIFLLLPPYTYLVALHWTYTILDLIMICFGFVIIFAYFFASMSLTIRRLHDCDLSGWWYLLSFILSPPVFLILCLIKGDKGTNRYGPPPEY